MEKSSGENVVQMEDADGNVMPEKVYYEYVACQLLLKPVFDTNINRSLQKQGLL